MRRLVFDENRVDAFVRQFVPGASLPGFRAVGLERDGDLTAGILYENFNDSNVWCHIAALPGGHSMNREFIESIFAYPFEQLGLRRMSAYVKESNTAVRGFMNNLGFRCEAVLEGAGDGGENMMVYVMKKEWCRYGYSTRRGR